MNRTRRNYLLLVLIGLFVTLGCKSCFSPQMKFEKVASPTVFTGPGQVITYSYIVKYESGGGVKFSITDDMLGDVLCETSEFAGSGSTTCQMTYVTTDEDVAARVIKNTATMIGVAEPIIIYGDTAMEYENTTLTASAEVVYEEPDCQLEFKKTASPTKYTDAGQVISYTYEIHNTGYSNVSGPFTIADDIIDEWSCDDGGSAFDLCVDCTITCSGTYTIQGSDVGSNITNTAHAEGVCGQTGETIASESASATVMYLGPTATAQAAQPELTVTISADPNVYSTAQTLIIYTYTIQNTGQSPVQGPFIIVDDRVDQWACDALDVMPVGGQLNCKGYYLIRESDVGFDITNSAHAQGANSAGVSNDVSATVYYFQQVNEGAGPAPTEPPKGPIYMCDGPCP